ncbi:transcription termination factor Rho [Corynebacterium pseudodiphtheriticum]|nr:transcription termination factor Rho [Corynebacterium pseudodiphtheriticum]RUQ01498.1 transcription termination factor Rho [Corynebacterium pseudodiphtheriticum]UNU76340.1 transcription termination factor Rho [Corynebacterium pseudodiphtheriticum]UNU78135.1 transcription termination factor Rho [Corynebacterium pseudodiphtheriticum]
MPRHLTISSAHALRTARAQAVVRDPRLSGLPESREKNRRERISVSTTDNPDLYSMKLPELRELAIAKGLKSITALRKGELIVAIETGKVPRKSTEKPLPRMKKSELEAQRAARLAAQESGTDSVRNSPEKEAPASTEHTEQSVSVKQNVTVDGGDRARDSKEGQQQPGLEKNTPGAAQEEETPSPAAARRARRARAKARANNNQHNQQHEHDRNRRNDNDSRRESLQATQVSEADEAVQAQDQEQQPVVQHTSPAANTRRGRRGRRVRRLGENNHQQEAAQNDSQNHSSTDNNVVEVADRGGQSERQDRTDHDHRNRNARGGRDDRDNRGPREHRNRGNNRDNNELSNDHSGNNQGGNHDSGNDQGGNNDNRNNGLQEVAGILEVVDGNAAFLRTTGYRPSSLDVFVNTNLVRRFHLRTGDYLTGKVKMTGGGQSHGKGRNRKKYNQMVFVETVNGLHPEEAKQRPQFSKLTPLYPNKRLRLETEPKILTTRVIDLIMPIGKGQRALIVSPPKAGKTTILQNIANAISTNNPECYLMVVLVDERPEEVTDMQRNVNGEVIASTFDRPPSEHTAVAELAIERAKRLVEQGQDVVVLLDSITRLGRAYNNSSPASGRILSGGVDSNALYPPKRFLGAARNIENGGSLTIIATAMVETGSTGDTVIFEEFKGTGNAELKLDRGISERRVFPAVDVNPSGTRKDELLLVPEEARIMTKLRRILSALDSHQAIDLLIKQLRKTKSNGEFLMQVASSAPMAAALEEED